MSEPITAGHNSPGGDLLAILGITDHTPVPLDDPQRHFHTVRRPFRSKTPGSESGGERR